MATIERRGGYRGNVAPTCKGTRTNGDPCRSTALGTDGYCSLHGDSPRLNASELGKKGGKKSAITRREQAKSVRDLIREKVDQHAEELWTAYYRGIVSDDLSQARQSADAAINQAHGKPLQPVQQAGKTIVIVHPLITAPKTIQVDGSDVIELPAGDIRED